MRPAGEHQGGERSSGNRESLDQLHSLPPFLGLDETNALRRCPTRGMPASIWPSPIRPTTPQTGLHR